MEKNTDNVFKCRAVRSYSDDWILTDVLTNEMNFRDWQIFDGDHLSNNLDQEFFFRIKDEWVHIEFDLVHVGEDGAYVSKVIGISK